MNEPNENMASLQCLPYPANFRGIGKNITAKTIVGSSIYPVLPTS